MLCRSSINWQQSERQPAVVAHPPAASLDEAHAAIEQWEYYSRKQLDSEQRLAVELMMAESEDGRWAADTTGRAESRQNGKGDEIEVVEFWGLFQRVEAILHTAHEAATAASAHMRMVGLVEGHRDLRVKVKKKQSWNGNYSLILNNDATIVWRTRTGAGGRGLDDMSRLVVDEAQHAQPEELASSSPILSVNPNPQKNFIGSGGVGSKSALWWRQRRRALAGDHGRFSWLEHSAEAVSLTPGGQVVTHVGDVADPELWKLANPAYPSRISHDFLLDQLKTLGPELFAREHLCVWDPEPDAEDASVPLRRAVWSPQADPSASIGKSPLFGLDVDIDRKASITAAWKRADGGVQVSLIEPEVDAFEAVGKCKALASKWQGRVMVPRAFEAEAIKAGLRVTVVKPAELNAASGALVDRVLAGTLWHDGDAALTDAALAARWATGSSADRSFDLRQGAVIRPLLAAVRALAGLSSTGPSAYEEHDLVVL